MEAISNQLVIIHFNDVYNIEEKQAEPVGGVARFKAALDSYKKYEPIILFSGDLFEPSLRNFIKVLFLMAVTIVSTAFHGEQMIRPINSFKIDCACFGNHEFVRIKNLLAIN